MVCSGIQYNLYEPLINFRSVREVSPAGKFCFRDRIQKVVKFCSTQLPFLAAHFIHLYFIHLYLIIEVNFRPINFFAARESYNGYARASIPVRNFGRIFGDGIKRKQRAHGNTYSCQK